MLILACQEVYNINLTLNDDSGTLNGSFFNYVDHIMTTFLNMVDSCVGIPLQLPYSRKHQHVSVSDMSRLVAPPFTT